MSEHSEQVALFEMMAFHPELSVAFAIPNGGFRNVKEAINLRREGVKAGVWDIFIPIQRKGYGGMFLEMKFGKNKLTPEQVEFGKSMDFNMYHCRVAYSAEQAYKFIIEYLGIEAKCTVTY